MHMHVSAQGHHISSLLSFQARTLVCWNLVKTSQRIYSNAGTIPKVHVVLLLLMMMSWFPLNVCDVVQSTRDVMRHKVVICVQDPTEDND